MSTKFYIKDENGIFLSTDGKVRYTLLEGKELYDFLKTEDGKRRKFHVDIDDDGNKIGIEAEPEQISALSEQHERERYLKKVQATLQVKIISANVPVFIPGEDEVDLISTLEDEDTDVEADAMHQMDLETLRTALLTLSKKEYDLIHELYLAQTPKSERQLAAELGIPRMTLNSRKQAILRKLKKFF